MLKGNSSLSATGKGDSSTLTNGDSTAKMVFSSSPKGDSTPSLETGGALITDQEKKDPEKASNKQKDSLSPLNDKDKSTDSSKEEGELTSALPTKEAFATSFDKKNNLSQNSKEAVSTLPVLSEKQRDVPLPKVGYVSLSSTPSAAPTSVVGSLPWEQREEKLRALLGIKKEAKDDEVRVQTSLRYLTIMTQSLEGKSDY